MKKWAQYFSRLTAGLTQTQVAEKIGVADQTTVGRWRRGETSPKDPSVVATVAQKFGANVLEAFVAAGFLNREEAGLPPTYDVDFFTLVDDDDSLSEQAKIHLKNQYGLLREASTVQRTHSLRDSIANDPELDEATRLRLLASFDSTASVAYTSSVTVVEVPFPGVPTRADFDLAADEAYTQSPEEEAEATEAST